MVFKPYLEFVVVFIENILVYSATLEEHACHLKAVFEELRKNELYLRLKR